MTGPTPAELERIRQEQGLRAMIKASSAPSKGQFGEAVRQTFDRDGPKAEQDPARRVEIAREERAARDAARAPYAAPDPPPVVISRISTRGRSQLEELVAHLQNSGLAARPDLVYGVYRVPDRISPTLTPQSEEGRVVEWDVVHAPADLPATDTAVDVVSFAAKERWIARRVGEPSVLDEELAALYLRRARIGASACLGVARLPVFSELPSSGGDAPGLFPRVQAVVALHPADAFAQGEAARMAGEKPLDAGPEALSGPWVERLEWTEIARVVHPQRHKPTRVPSPFPYLPSSPYELLRAYLEVVGVQPADCLSAQVTINRAFELVGEMGMGSTNVSPKQPCADGKERGRLHGARQVVIAYEDAPAYAQGRERWAAYQREVLQARLDDATGRHRPLEDDDVTAGIESGVLRRAAKVADTIDKVAVLGEARAPSPFRFCWPPVGR